MAPMGINQITAWDESFTPRPFFVNSTCALRDTLCADAQIDRAAITQRSQDGVQRDLGEVIFKTASPPTN